MDDSVVKKVWGQARVGMEHIQEQPYVQPLSRATVVISPT